MTPSLLKSKTQSLQITTAAAPLVVDSTTRRRKISARKLWLICLLLFTAFSSAAYSAQPLKLNYICASGGVGGFQDSSDIDIGHIVLHTVLNGLVADGRYNIHVNWDSTGGNDAFVDIAGGVIVYGQDSVVIQADWYSLGTGAGMASVPQNQANGVSSDGSVTAGFVPAEGDHYDCCSYGCSGPGDLSANIECYDYRRSNPNPNPNPHTDADRNAATTAAYRTAHYAGRQERAEMRRKRWHGALQRA